MGCHVCGKDHGTRHYFDICAPKHSYRLEMEKRAEEMRAAANVEQSRNEQVQP